jgi:RNA-binding protein MEX3
MNSHGTNLENQRVLQQIALELSNLGLSPNDHHDNNNTTTNFTFDNEQPRKSANYTESVHVPSSEHVAEIVGRQGCKIKGLRAKTNTYIKTPMRIEEPVFVVTGRKEDVAEAKKEILSAAEHFTQIRASRRSENNNGGAGSPTSPGSCVNPGSSSSSLAPTSPGHITAQLPVPLKEVGLVVGPKGATIKRIQQQTQTYIVTPGRDKKPIFEVTGLPENVEKACDEIRRYLDMRTGRCHGGGGSGSVNHLNSMNLNTSRDSDPTADFHSNGISLDAGSYDNLSAAADNDLLNSLYKPPSANSAFSSYKNGPGGGYSDFTRDFFPQSSSGGGAFGLYDSDEGISSLSSPTAPTNNCHNIWSELPGDGGSLSLFTPITPGSGGLANNNNNRGGLQRGSASSPPPALGAGSNGGSGSLPDDPVMALMFSMYQQQMLASAVVSAQHQQPTPSLYSVTQQRSMGSSSSSPTDSTGSGSSRPPRRPCILCKDADVVAALVPCGHNLMCMECANQILEKNDPVCPAPEGCMMTPKQVIRIFS